MFNKKQTNIWFEATIYIATLVNDNLSSIFFFLKCSNPSMAADGTWTSNYWPIHTPVKREVLVLNAEHQGQLEGLRVRKCAFWKNFLPRLLAMSKY